MRFDDTLDTVLATDLTTPASVQAAWRQMIDLIGRRRADATAETMRTLEAMRREVPATVRAASARALSGARPPAALVRLFGCDDIAVGAPLLRGVELAAEEWIALLPELGPTARAVLRHRRDLPAAVLRALESFGPVDFVLSSNDVPVEAPAVQASFEPAVPVAADPGPFVSVGSVAMALPVVAEALRRENDNEGPGASDGTFRIADIVARIEAFQHGHGGPRRTAPGAGAVAGRFRFETDAGGSIRTVEGVPRGSFVGLSLARPARPGGAGVDGAAAGAFRRRSRFGDGRLLVEGAGDASGTWLISAVPAFDPASGRFTGYRGSGRRPRYHEQAHGGRTADALRQLVHELRTPTNAIAGFSEMIEHQLFGPVAYAYRAQAMAIRTEVDALLAAIDDLDIAARIEAGALPLRAERVALAPLLVRIAGALAGLAEERGAALSLPVEDAAVLADRPSLERLLTRLLGTMLGSAAGETIAVRLSAAGGDRVGLVVDRPAALQQYPGETILAVDDETSGASLLGRGFALRLVRNLARELGGSLAIGAGHLTLYLPAAVDRPMEQARYS